MHFRKKPFHSLGSRGRSSQSPAGQLASRCAYCSLAQANFFGHIPLKPGKLKCRRHIGSGSYGDVYEGTYFGAPVAIKCLNRSAVRSEPWNMGTTSGAVEEEIDNMEHEARVLRSLRHPNVLYFYAFTYDPPRIITEYCPAGSLYNSLHGRNPLKDWRKKLGIVKGIAAGMRYLHERPVPIVHCDLKSLNILMGCCGQSIIADVGLAKIVRVENQLAGHDKTPGDLNFLYHPPEVILSKDGSAFSEKSDVYSTAIIMWEILTHRIPFNADRAFHPGVFIHQTAKEIVRGLRPEIPEDLTKIPGWHPILERYISLMQRCWSHDPDDRPTFEHLEAEISAILEEYVGDVPVADNITCAVPLWLLCRNLLKAFKSMGHWVRNKFWRRTRHPSNQFLLDHFMNNTIPNIESPFEGQPVPILASSPVIPSGGVAMDRIRSLPDQIPHSCPRPIHGSSLAGADCPTEEVESTVQLTMPAHLAVNALLRWSSGSKLVQALVSPQDLHISSLPRLLQNKGSAARESIDRESTIDSKENEDIFDNIGEEESNISGLSCASTRVSTDDEGA